MIEHPTKSNSKNIGLDWIGLFDWIELKKSNPIQYFWSWIWLNVQSSIKKSINIL
jgi:hypothetical protein